MGETVNVWFYAQEDGTFVVQVKQSWSGHIVSGRFFPPYTGRQLNTLQRKLSRLDSHDHELREIGQRLFASLCGVDTRQKQDYKTTDSQVYQALRDVIRRTLSRRGTVALMLGFGPGCDEFVRYPWELLHNDDHFLLASGVFTLSRVLLRLDNPGGCDLPVHPPFRILYISASPNDCVPLETESSFEAMREALTPLLDTGQILLDRLEPPTFSQLVRYLNSYGGMTVLNDRDTVIPCYVIHFDGHGAYGRLCPREQCETMNDPDASVCQECGTSLRRIKAQTHLCFCNEDGSNHFINTQTLRNLLLSSDVRLAVFSACETAMVTGEVSLAEKVTGRSVVDATLATALVTAQVPAVVAMPFSLRDDLSPTFMYHFYEALATGRTLEEALSRSRQALLSMQQRSWFIPVLYRHVTEDNESPVPLMEAGDTRERSGHPLAYLGASSVFVGREQELKELGLLITDAVVNRSETSMVQLYQSMQLQPIHHIVLTGPTGIGKSALAFEVVRRHYAKFPGGVIGVSLRNGKTFSEALNEMIRRLHLQVRSLTSSDIAQRSRLVLSTFRSLASRELPSLLLLDGFEEVRDREEFARWLQFLHALPQEVVVLATAHVDPGMMSMHDNIYIRWYDYHVGKMEHSDLFKLFIVIASVSGLYKRIRLDTSNQQATLNHICDLLDGYPLGAELIVGMPRTIDGIVYRPEATTRSLEEICDDLHSMPPAGVVAALEIPYQRLSHVARLLLPLVALLTDSFDRSDIKTVVNHALSLNGVLLKEDDAQLLQTHWRTARDELVQTSFLQFDGHRYLMHTQIRLFALSRLSDSIRETLQQMISDNSSQMSEILQQTVNGDMRHRPSFIPDL